MNAVMQSAQARIESDNGETPSTPILRAGPSLDPREFATLRTRTVLDGCKWDPQVGDISTLLPFPLIMKRREWNRLAQWAEQLTAEALAAETEVLKRPSLLAGLGLPRALRRVLASSDPLTPAAGRVMRFDFHPTTDGWRISEVNSDVPGGFSEASCFTALMAEHFPELSSAGNPGDVWADALAGSSPGTIAFLSVPGYMEDHQVNAFIAARLRERGCKTFLVAPQQIRWEHGAAMLRLESGSHKLDAIVRFYQAEWISRLPHSTGWNHFFRGGKTPIANPASAVIPESKRFPLIWPKLSTPMPTWQTLLPETRDPRDASWVRDETWLLKSAMCNNGDTVTIREMLKPSEWSKTGWAARLFPGNWVAQKRFESAPLATPVGPRHACLGVYTINGRAIGCYARLAAKPLIDFSAEDVALLLEDDD